jgi:hypothetical protein
MAALVSATVIRGIFLIRADLSTNFAGNSLICRCDADAVRGILTSGRVLDRDAGNPRIRDGRPRNVSRLRRPFNRFARHVQVEI